MSNIQLNLGNLIQDFAAGALAIALVIILI